MFKYPLVQRSVTPCQLRLAKVMEKGGGEKERREDILGKGCGKGTVGKGGGGGGSGRVSTGQGSLTHGV